MFRKHNGQLMTTPPATVELDGFVRKFAALSREEWDSIGFNEAVPVRREPFTAYETRWVTGDDLICREEVVSQTLDEAARDASLAAELRTRRNLGLTATDWTQLQDAGLDAQAMVLWQSYRQALRDVPQQPGFPVSVDWPDQPSAE